MTLTTDRQRLEPHGGRGFFFCVSEVCAIKIGAAFRINIRSAAGQAGRAGPRTLFDRSRGRGLKGSERLLSSQRKRGSRASARARSQRSSRQMPAFADMTRRPSLWSAVADRAAGGSATRPYSQAPARKTRRKPLKRFETDLEMAGGAPRRGRRPHRRRVGDPALQRGAGPENSPQALEKAKNRPEMPGRATVPDSLPYAPSVGGRRAVPGGRPRHRIEKGAASL